MKKLLLGGLIIVVAISVLAGCNLVKKTLTPEEAKSTTETFINENLVSPDNTVTITDVTEESGVYKLVVNFSNGQTVNSFVTKDGTKFFTEAMEIKKPGEETGKEVEVNLPEISKTDKPKVELFVMSYCPYGTQMEKGILPVLESLGDSVAFELKFCDYAMHQKKELDEQMRQYCIQKNEPAKLLGYLKCFLEEDVEGQAEKCVKEAGINNTNLANCVAAADKEFKVTEKFNDQTTWLNGQYPVFDIYKEEVIKYGVGGSPTLVINEVKMGETQCNSDADCHPGEACVNTQTGKACSMQRDSESIKQAICSVFTTQPEACATELSSTSSAPGFGFEGTGSNTDAQCN